MRSIDVEMDNQAKLLNILNTSYNKVLRDLKRIDKYLFEEDIPYACEDIYDRMTNIVNEVVTIDGITEENEFIKNYINVRDVILHSTLKEAFDICTKYAEEVEDKITRLN